MYSHTKQELTDFSPLPKPQDELLSLLINLDTTTLLDAIIQGADSYLGTSLPVWGHGQEGKMRAKNVKILAELIKLSSKIFPNNKKFVTLQFTKILFSIKGLLGKNITLNEIIVTKIQNPSFAGRTVEIVAEAIEKTLISIFPSYNFQAIAINTSSLSDLIKSYLQSDSVNLQTELMKLLEFMAPSTFVNMQSPFTKKLESLCNNPVATKYDDAFRFI